MLRRFSTAFNWKDPLLARTLLTKEEAMIQASAHRFCQDVLMPVVRDNHRHETFDKSLIRQMGEMGFLGMQAGYNSYGIVAKEVERVDSAYRSAMSVQSSLVIHPIREFGSDYQKQKYLPKLESGEFVGCFGLTEPNHGSDPSSMESKLRKRDDGNYTLSGSKNWITNAPIADVFVVWAKDENQNVRGCILERDMPGLETHKIEGKFSLRASPTGSIFMDDVTVPENNVLPDVYSLRGPFSCLNSARFGISWGALGAAEFCYEAAKTYTEEREQFGAPLSANQLVQTKLVDMMTDITTSQLACIQVGRLMDAGHSLPEMVSFVKRNSCEHALRIARTARAMLGGNGISDEYDVIRHVMNLEAVSTYEGTSDIHALILGQAITNIPAFSSNVPKIKMNKAKLFGTGVVTTYETT